MPCQMKIYFNYTEIFPEVISPDSLTLWMMSDCEQVLYMYSWFKFELVVFLKH